jgi:hypothetical protein
MLLINYNSCYHTLQFKINSFVEEPLSMIEMYTALLREAPFQIFQTINELISNTGLSQML